MDRKSNSQRAIENLKAHLQRTYKALISSFYLRPSNPHLIIIMQLLTVITFLLLALTASASPVTFSSGPRSLGANNGTTTPATQPFPFDYSDDNLNSLVETFAWIENIPDDVIISGPAALKKYCEDHGYLKVGNLAVSARDNDGNLDRREDNSLAERQNWLQIADCVASITRAIAEGYFPAAKLLRIKDLIKKGGGVYKVAKALLKARSWGELAELGDAVYELALALSGIGGIISSCFNMF